MRNKAMPPANRRQTIGTRRWRVIDSLKVRGRDVKKEAKMLADERNRRFPEREWRRGQLLAESCWNSEPKIGRLGPIRARRENNLFGDGAGLLSQGDGGSDASSTPHLRARCRGEQPMVSTPARKEL